MFEIEFKSTGVDGQGEKLYELRIGGKLIEEGLTIDQVICRISRDDEARLGERQMQLPEDLRQRHSRR